MEKINFINQSTPALNATNLNKLQDNVEDALQEVQDDVDTKLNADSIKTTQTNSDTDTYSCNYVNNIINEVYSQTETKTNKTWIDGKPIYRKVVVSNDTLASGGNDIAHGISNLGTVVDVYGYIPFGTGTFYKIGAYESSNNFVSIINVNTTRVAVRVGSGWGGSFTGGCFVVLEYTKTTD